MAQRIIEMLIGRLVTDEAFRDQFLENPEGTLADLNGLGFELSRTEVAALMNTEQELWARTAEGIDPRLLKISLHKALGTTVVD